MFNQSSHFNNPLKQSTNNLIYLISLFRPHLLSDFFVFLIFIQFMSLMISRIFLCNLRCDVKQDFLRDTFLCFLVPGKKSIFLHFRTFFLSVSSAIRFYQSKNSFIISNVGFTKTKLELKQWSWRDSKFPNLSHRWRITSNEMPEIQFIFIFNREWQPIRFHVKNQWNFNQKSLISIMP